MALDDTFQNLSSFLNSLDAEGEQKFELSHSLVIICPDCGKNIAFRGRCPKCGGNSWIPAGHAGGIFERMKAQRWKTMINVDDDTGSFTEGAPAIEAGRHESATAVLDAPEVEPSFGERTQAPEVSTPQPKRRRPKPSE
jgi:hypothetical protein